MLNGQFGPQTGNIPANLDILLGAGTDSVSFDLGTSPIIVAGSLGINYGTGGTGTKTTQTTGAATNNLTVGGSFGIHYAAGDVTTALHNLAVGGNLVVTHATGDSTFTLDNRAGAGVFSSIHGGLSVTNTQGVADNIVLDTNITGSVAFANGRARASDNAAGTTKFANSNNTTTLATIGGSLAIGNASGDNSTGDTVGDVLVKGNVTLSLGSGAFKATVAAQHASTGPIIDGSLAVGAATKGTDTVALGAGGTGLTVKTNVTVRSGNPGATVTMDDMHVTGTTTIVTGTGADTVSIDGAAEDQGSTFHAFAINSGAGIDTVNIGSGSASGATTMFKSSVQVSLGSGDDALKLATAGKVNFTTVRPVFDGSTGTNTKTFTTTNLEGKSPIFKNLA